MNENKLFNTMTDKKENTSRLSKKLQFLVPDPAPECESEA